VGIDFIVCDQHLPDETLPKAVALLDPKRTDCNYPFKELSGCGIGFKLIQAFEQAYLNTTIAVNFIDFVAVSIAADIVPIVDEIFDLWKRGGALYACGNGGSAATASEPNQPVRWSTPAARNPGATNVNGDSKAKQSASESGDRPTNYEYSSSG